MPSSERRFPDTLILTLLFLLGMVLFGSAALYLGRDVSWDVRNYHYYNGYAWLSGRLGFDLAPAQLQSFFNPILDGLAYLLMSSVNGRLAGVLIGMIHGLNFGVAAGLVKACLDQVQLGKTRWTRWSLAGLLALLGCTSATHVREIGALYHDNVVSIPILAGIWCSVLAFGKGKESHAGRWIAGSAFLLGLATGLKLTSATYAVAATAGWIVIWMRLPALRRFAWVWAVAGVAGFLLTAGWHMWTLYRLYGNPFFPYFNPIFRSPWVPPVEIGDARWLTKSLRAALLRPIQLAQLSMTSSEWEFRDARYLMMFAGVLSVLTGSVCKLVFCKRPDSASADPAKAAAGHLLCFLGIFCVSAFCVWVKLFGYARYLVPLDAIIPIFLVIAAGSFARFRPMTVPLTIVALCASIFWAHGYYEPRMPWSAKYVEPQVPVLPAPEKSMVVVLGGEPMAYVVPAFDPRVRFVRPDGNLVDQSPRKTNVYREYVWKTVAEHDGDLYALVMEGEHKPALLASVPAWTGWRVDPSDEFRIEPSYGGCPYLVRMRRTLAAGQQFLAPREGQVSLEEKGGAEVPIGEFAKRIEQCPLAPESVRLDGDSARKYLGNGWSNPEPGFRWTEGNEAEFLFRQPLAASNELVLRAAGFGKQRVTVSLNGENFYEFVAEHVQEQRIPLPPEKLKPNRNVLTFQMPDAKSPASMGLGSDSRVLGLQVEEIGIRGAGRP